MTRERKKPSYESSVSDSLVPTLVIHGEREGQVHTDTADDEAPTEDINHDDAGEQPLPMATTTSVLWRSSRVHLPSRRYNVQEYVLLTYSDETESYQDIHDSKKKQD